MSLGNAPAQRRGEKDKTMAITQTDQAATDSPSVDAGCYALPVLSCDDCGACCFEQGSPPGYLGLMNGVLSRDEWPDEDDIPRLDSMPDEARAVLLAYGADLRSGKADGDGACVWLDQTTMRCRWYEHRPQICRDLDRGSEGCRSWRDEYNIDVDAIRSA